MSLSQFFSILRARIGLVFVILLVTVGAALAWVVLRPPSYTARAPVLVDMRVDPVGATPLQGMVSPSYMTTQIDIIKSDRVAERAVQMLPKDQEPLLRLSEEAQTHASPQAWLTHEIQTSLEVKPARESNIINVSWSGRSPAEAARVANAFAQAYLDVAVDLKANPSKRYAEWFDDQVKAARERMETAQERLSAFQEKAGIVSSDEKTDYETTRLSEIGQQLAMLESRSVDARGTASEVQNPVVNNLRQDVNKLEAQVREASETMGVNHPKLQRMQAELGAMRSRLSQEAARVGAVAGSAFQNNKGRQRELQRELAAQKARVLSLKKQRGELTVLQREADSAQKAYETVSASAAQSRLQSQATQSNAIFLASAVEPLEKSGLSGKLALLIAVVGGLLLATAVALLMELINRRVRSVEDISMVTQLPILASIPNAGSRIVPLRLTGPSPRLALTARRSLA